MPELDICNVNVFPLLSVNCDDVSVDRHSSLPDAPPDVLLMTANLMLAIEPPVAVNTTSSASSLYWPALAPTVQTMLANALPLEL